MRNCWIAFVLIAAASAAQAQDKKKDPSPDVFKPGAIWKVNITVDPDNLKLLQREPRKYVRAKVAINDENFEDVGIHIKGAAGSTRDWNDKPALTLNTDKFKKDQKWKGLDKFHLNNSVQDGCYMNEILCSEISRNMGLPTARGTHAIVTLNDRMVNLYVLKEGYNGKFIERNFPNEKGGLLYDGGFVQDINADLKLDDGESDDRKSLKALANACNDGDANNRYAAVEKLVNLDLFCKMAALQMVCCDWDGYCRNSNNYRLYFPPKDGKAVFIPHGMDQMFGNTGESLWHGAGGMVWRTVMEHPEGKKKAIAAIKELCEKHFKLETLNKRIDEWTKPVLEALKANGDKDPTWFENEAKGLKDRLKQRSEYITRELPNLK